MLIKKAGDKTEIQVSGSRTGNEMILGFKVVFHQSSGRKTDARKVALLELCSGR